jgi:hypothetical protein
MHNMRPTVQVGFDESGPLGAVGSYMNSRTRRDAAISQGRARVALSRRADAARAAYHKRDRAEAYTTASYQIGKALNGGQAGSIRRPRSR